MIPKSILLLVAGLGLGLPAPAAAPDTAQRHLPNGVTALALHFPGSTNVAVFSFLPMGLAGDGPGQTQWSHLIEHLVLRRTVPAEARWANAETLPDHLRLDFYGHNGNWREGLEHQRQWLTGGAMEEPMLAAEKLNVLRECDFTERTLATHKFAIAGWNQVMRNNPPHVGVRSDVTNAKREELERLRNKHLFVPMRTTVCMVGGVATDEALAAMAETFGELESVATVRGFSPLPPGEHAVTWDLASAHLLFTWPVPAPADREHAALMFAGQSLTMRLFNDPEMKAFSGVILAGTDLTPDGTNWFFQLSASIKPGVDAGELESKILARLDSWLADDSAFGPAPLLGRRLGLGMLSAPDPQPLRANLPPNVTGATLEMNLGLQWAAQHHRYRDSVAKLAANLQALTATEVQSIARRLLGSATRTRIWFAPGKPASD